MLLGTKVSTRNNIFWFIIDSREIVPNEEELSRRFVSLEKVICAKLTYEIIRLSNEF